MAKSRKQVNVANGIFESVPIGIDENKTSISEAMDFQPTKESKLIGRPRAADISSEDKIIRTSFNLTEDLLRKLKIYAASTGKDNSQVIRELIRSLVE